MTTKKTMTLTADELHERLLAGDPTVTAADVVAARRVEADTAEAERLAAEAAEHQEAEAAAVALAARHAEIRAEVIDATAQRIPALRARYAEALTALRALHADLSAYGEARNAAISTAFNAGMGDAGRELPELRVDRFLGYVVADALGSDFRARAAAGSHPLLDQAVLEERNAAARAANERLDQASFEARKAAALDRLAAANSGSMHPLSAEWMRKEATAALVELGVTVPA